MVVGDSHADMAKPRFAKLYEDAVKAKKQFPTVAFRTRFGRALLPCRPEYHEVIELLKMIKLQVVMFVIHCMHFIYFFLVLRRTGLSLLLHNAAKMNLPKQNMEDVRVLMKKYDMSDLGALGVKVFVVDQGPEMYWQDPFYKRIAGDSCQICILTNNFEVLQYKTHRAV
ncbi:hypothetical protein THRCLA_03021 [Thraustotheca clavata]|uniref:Uncharacterized protein n=1 Tax=Thraustotheca clavata TaxID=74557 RepID=A0A1W0A3K1_9STRA|nr:hypothetical protein THRCLA_03021 [Thraustotheca clavata]